MNCDVVMQVSILMSASASTTLWVKVHVFDARRLPDNVFEEAPIIDDAIQAH